MRGACSFAITYHRGTTYIMFSESESEDDLLEQAYDYKVNGNWEVPRRMYVE